MLAAGAIAGCEFVLGDLPPARQHDGGAGGSGGEAAASSSSSGSGGASSSGSSGSGGACCDCDGDKHLAAGLCGGDDCDDHDSTVFPGEPVFFGAPNPTVGFDFDCDKATTRDPALDKAVDCPPVGLPCPAGEGFLAAVPPACGEVGTWGTCTQQGLNCVKNTIDANRKMKCK